MRGTWLLAATLWGCAQVEAPGGAEAGPADAATGPVDARAAGEVADSAAIARDAGEATDAAGTRPSDGAASDGGTMRCEDLPFRALPFCPKNTGVCAGARFHCEDGRAVPCQDADYRAYHASYADPETDALCDGLDNDCDGRTDEACACAAGATQPCGTDLGECVAGVQTCTGAAWGRCEGPLGPLPERCNGLDDDCDGRADEDTADEAPPCAQQAGVCAGARRRCGGAAGWAECDAAALAAHAALYVRDEGGAHCDGVDNDCDGRTDEGCECRPGESRACGTDAGECRPGTQTCDGGRWRPCDGEGPREETCSGRDDDCDGVVDEGDTCPERHACRAGACVRTSALVQAESGARGHAVGREERGGWCAGTGDYDEGYLTFGPYLDDLPAGEYEAVWRLLVDDHAAHDDDVARLEVNDYDRRPNCGDCVIAARNVERREFAGDFEWQEIGLRFRNPGEGHRLEFRTRWYDVAYLCEDRVEIRRVD